MLWPFADDIASCSDVCAHVAHFDEATGLIEIAGKPRPPETFPDYSVAIRHQLEAIIAEWEAALESAGSLNS